MRILLLLTAAACACAQTQSSGHTSLSGATEDSSAAAWTKPAKTGTGAPVSTDCDASDEIGREYNRTNASAANASKYVCVTGAGGVIGWEVPGSGATVDCTALDVILGGGAAGYISVTPNGSVCEIEWDKTPFLAATNAFTGLQSNTPSTAQAITAVGNTILANANNIEVDPDGTYTLTSTPTIADGVNGQPLTINNIDAALTLTLQAEANLASSNICGSSNISIGPKESRRATFTTALNCWSFQPAGSTTTATSTPRWIYGPPDASPGGILGLSSAGTLYYAFDQPYTATYTSVVIPVVTTGGSGSTGLSVAIMDSSCNLVVRATTVTGLNAVNSTTPLVATFASTTLTGGSKYFIGVVSDDTSLRLMGTTNVAGEYVMNKGGSSSTYNAFFGGAPTGSAGTIAAPSTCGSRSIIGGAGILFAYIRP